MPTSLRPDIRDVTTPHLIRRTNLEFAIEMVRDIDPLDRGLLVGMATRLLADQPEFFHQAADLEASNRRTFLAHHAHDAATASRASTLDEQLVYPATQCHALGINASGSPSVGIQAGPRHVEYRADQLDRFACANLINYFVRSMPSDIKSAVAFFKMAFSRSRRSIRASSS